MNKLSKIISFIAISAVLSTALLCLAAGTAYLTISDFGAVAAALREQGVEKEALAGTIDGIKRLILFTDGEIDAEKAITAVFDVYENTDTEVLAQSCYAYFHPVRNPVKELSAAAFYSGKSVKIALNELNAAVKERFGTGGSGDLFVRLAALDIEDWRLLFSAVEKRAELLSTLPESGQSTYDFIADFVSAEDKNEFFSTVPMATLHREVRRLAALIEPDGEELRLIEKLADTAFNEGFAPLLQEICRTLKDIGSADFLTVGINLIRETEQSFAALLKFVFQGENADIKLLNDSLRALSGVECDFYAIAFKSYALRTAEENEAVRRALSGFLDNFYLLI